MGSKSGAADLIFEVSDYVSYFQTLYLEFTCVNAGFAKLTAAKCFFRRLMKAGGQEPRKIVTDKLRSYGVAHRELTPETIHSTKQYENKRVEQSHEATSLRERGMRRFRSVKQAQRFVTAHAAVHNLFNLGRHLVSAEHYRNLRITAFSEWSRTVI